MKNLVFASCVLFAVIQTGLSIRCYQCVSKGCSTIANCSSAFDSCSFTHTKLGDTYAHSCNKKSACDLAATGCEKSKQCAVKCCQADLCNKDGPRAAAATISSKAFYPVTLAVLILYYLF